MDKNLKIELYPFHDSKRKLSLIPQIEHVGLIPEKWVWHKQRFPDNLSFSLILKGSGRYHRFGKTWEVKAPCVITQWPNDIIEYGPEPCWTEIYISYKAELIEQFIDAGYLKLKQPIWRIHNFAFMDQQAKQLVELLTKNPNRELIADKVDHLCLSIIANTVSVQLNEETDKDELKIYELKRKIEDNLEINWDITMMAEFCHMSEATFNRRWKQFSQLTPKQFIIQSKLDLATNLLSLTNLPIKEIAQKAHFQDYFYFARIFKKKMTLSPRDYRKKFR